MPARGSQTRRTWGPRRASTRHRGRVRRRPLHLRRGRRRRRPDHRRPADGRLRRATAAKSGISRSTRPASRAAAVPLAAGRPRSASVPCWSAPAIRSMAAARQSTRCCVEASAGAERPLAALDHVGSWLGRRHRRPHERPESEPGGARRTVRAASIRSSESRSSDLQRAGASAVGSHRFDRSRLSRPRCPLLGAAELAFEELLDDPITAAADSAGSHEWRVVA